LGKNNIEILALRILAKRLKRGETAKELNFLFAA
jgi:hypothetical protein